MRDRPDVHLACPGCDRPYTQEQIEVIGSHVDTFLIKCLCYCGRISTFMVNTSIKLLPVSFEDVLIAHEFLEKYEGDAMGLFDPNK